MILEAKLKTPFENGQLFWALQEGLTQSFVTLIFALAIGWIVHRSELELYNIQHREEVSEIDLMTRLDTQNDPILVMKTSIIKPEEAKNDHDKNHGDKSHDSSQAAINRNDIE